MNVESGVEEEKKPQTNGAMRVRYTERGKNPVLVRCMATDPFEVLEWVFKRMDAEA